MSKVPSKVPCPKCGSMDVLRKYRRRGEKWAVSGMTDDSASAFVNAIDNWFRKATRECITHHCRTCQYNWQTATLKPRKKV